MRSETFGYTVLYKFQEIAVKLSQENDPSKIQKLKKMLDQAYVLWERTAERRKKVRKDCEHKRVKDYFCVKCGCAVK